MVKKSVNFQSTSCVSGILLDAGNRKKNWMGPLAFKGVTDNYTNNYHTVSGIRLGTCTNSCESGERWNGSRKNEVRRFKFKRNC